MKRLRRWPLLILACIVVACRRSAPAGESTDHLTTQVEEPAAAMTAVPTLTPFPHRRSG